MGVEYGKNNIDPNDGDAPLNLSVTCDGIPIENAFVEVKVDPQEEYRRAHARHWRRTPSRQSEWHQAH